jgi:hypothetical protein
MNRHWIIICLIIIIILIIISSRFEHYVSNESVQNLANLYNNQNLNVTNLQITDTANIKNKLDVCGSIVCDGSGVFNTINFLKSKSLNDISGSFSSISSVQIVPTVKGLVLTSPNGENKFAIQDDGNLVLYDKTNYPIWAKNMLTSPNKSYQITVNDNGVLSLIKDKTNVIYTRELISHHVIMTDTWAWESWLKKIEDDKYFSSAMPLYTVKIFYIIHSNGTNATIITRKISNDTFNFHIGGAPTSLAKGKIL